jgi:hypothetical protein
MNFSYFSKLGSVCFVFVSTFHSSREEFLSQSTIYKMPSFETFCDSLVQEKDNLLHLGLISTTLLPLKKP